MAMRTNYQDFVPESEHKHYQQITNEDGTVSLVDQTTYLQEGDTVNAALLNELSQNAIWPLTHSKSGTVHTLTGLPSTVTGTVTVQFKATAAFKTGDKIKLSTQTSNSTIMLSNGETPEDNLFVSGATVSAIIDVSGNIVNFKSGGPGKTMVTEIIAATQDWVVPRGVTSISVRLFGAGGGGSSYAGGAGGNGGSMSYKVLNVTPGTKYTITIGKGGIQNTTGGASSFGTLLSANGGVSGGVGAGGGGAPGGKTTQGEYGGAGGSAYNTAGKAGTNTVGKGLEFEGTGAAGKAGAKGSTISGHGVAGNGGGGGSGGYGGSGGKGGAGGTGGTSYTSGSTPRGGGSGGNGGHGGGGGFGAVGGQGGAGGNGGNADSFNRGPSGGHGGHGGGGGFGGPGGTGGKGGNGANSGLWLNNGTGGSGGMGGGGGYGKSGVGGTGGNGGGGSGSQSGQSGQPGQPGGIAAGGGCGGEGGSYYNDGSATAPGGGGGTGGNGVCIISYMGYR